MDTFPMAGSIVVMSMTDTSAKAAPPTSQLVAVRVQETHAEGLQEAGAGVIGGAAAETDDDSSNAKTGGGEQQFAGTIG